VWLTELIGPANAAMVLGSARRVDADLALRLGIAQAVGPADDALELLGVTDPAGMRATKAALREAAPPHVRASLRDELDRAVELIACEHFVDSLGRERSVRGAA
jgi:enoyl-CoA hydratase/carnithine racemase